MARRFIGLKRLKRLKRLKEFKVERVKGKVAERGGEIGKAAPRRAAASRARAERGLGRGGVRMLFRFVEGPGRSSEPFGPAGGEGDEGEEEGEAFHGSPLVEEVERVERVEGV